MNKNIIVIGRRWFERTNGNTYHSCEVSVNGNLVGRVSFRYGYGSAYEQTALEILSEHLPQDYSDTRKTALWRACENAGDSLYSNVFDVHRKKDL